MRREAEFKAYLKDLGKDDGFICRKVKYCHYAEDKTYKDMDDIVASEADIDVAMDILKKYYAKNAFDQIRPAVRTYAKFASSTKVVGWTAMPPISVSAGAFKTYEDTTGLVVYENSVPSYEQVFGLCEFLENEYDKIRVFARDVLKNIWQHFPAIPVYLSKECPEEVFQHDRSLLMKKFRKICKECDRNYCAPDCPAFNRISEEMYFTETIGGRYYGGAEPHIVLYFKNFPKAWDVSESKFTAAIAKTLAHEYLHFLHDYYVKTVAKMAVDPFKDERISEALADFFGVLYALKQGYTATAEDRYYLWKLHEGTGWPYSYALKFFKNPYKANLKNYSDANISNATQKFRDVFKNTTDPKCAKKILGI